MSKLIQDQAIMDDARTQRTLDHLADLYLSSQPASPSDPSSSDDAAGPSRPSSESSRPSSSSSPSQIPPQSPPLRLPPKLRVSHPPGPAQPGRGASPDRPPHAAAGPAQPWAQVRAERRARQQAWDDVAAEEQETASMAADYKSPADLYAEAMDDAPTNYTFPSQQSRSYDIASSGVMTDGPAIAPPPAVVTDPVQAVFLGNLPGFAGPWLAQYAQLLAQPQQRVAIIHVQGDELRVEIVSPQGRKLPDALASGQDNLIDVLERLTQDQTCPLTRWLVHLPLPASAHQLEMARDLDCWTLLTGRDDAALAAGEKWLGVMLADDRRAPFRRVGAAVMGCDPDDATAVIERLEARAGEQLSSNIVQRPGRRQMAPVNIAQLGVFTPTSELWTELVAYLASFEAPGDRPTDAPQASTGTIGAQTAWQQQGSSAAGQSFQIPPERRAPQSRTPAVAASQPDTTQAAPPPASAVGRTQVEASAGSATPHVANHATAAASASQPEQKASTTQQTTQQPTQQTTQQADQLVLASLVDSQLASLQARCPYHPQIELAVDGQGVLHLLARPVSPAGGQSSPEVAIHETIVALQATGKWAAEHIALLQLTAAEHAFDESSPAVLHLLHEHGPACAKIATSLAGTLRVHLLVHVAIGDQQTLAASPLN